MYVADRFPLEILRLLKKNFLGTYAHVCEHSPNLSEFLRPASDRLDISATGIPMQWTSGHWDAAVWIGLTDAAEVGTFRWSDGSPLDYDHWASGQPGSFGPSCAEMFPDHVIGANPDTRYNHWQNEHCDAAGWGGLRAFVCKKAANS